MKLIDKTEFIKKLIHRQWNIDDDTGNHDDAIRIDEIGKIIDMLDNEETIDAIPIEKPNKREYLIRLMESERKK